MIFVVIIVQFVPVIRLIFKQIPFFIAHFTSNLLIQIIRIWNRVEINTTPNRVSITLIIMIQSHQMRNYDLPLWWDKSGGWHFISKDLKLIYLFVALKCDFDYALWSRVGDNGLESLKTLHRVLCTLYAHSAIQSMVNLFNSCVQLFTFYEHLNYVYNSYKFCLDWRSSLWMDKLFIIICRISTSYV